MPKLLGDFAIKPVWMALVIFQREAFMARPGISGGDHSFEKVTRHMYSQKIKNGVQNYRVVLGSEIVCNTVVLNHSGINGLSNKRKEMGIAFPDSLKSMRTFWT